MDWYINWYVVVFAILIGWPIAAYYYFYPLWKPRNIFAKATQFLGPASWITAIVMPFFTFNFQDVINLVVVGGPAAFLFWAKHKFTNIDQATWARITAAIAVITPTVVGFYNDNRWLVLGALCVLCLLVVLYFIARAYRKVNEGDPNYYYNQHKTHFKTHTTSGATLAGSLGLAAAMFLEQGVAQYRANRPDVKKPVVTMSQPAPLLDSFQQEIPEEIDQDRVNQYRMSMSHDQSLKGVVVVLSPGHGEAAEKNFGLAADPGDHRGDWYESNLNLDIAARIEDYVVAQGGQAFYPVKGADGTLDFSPKYFDLKRPPAAVQDLLLKLGPMPNATTPTEKAVSCRTNFANGYVRSYGANNVYFLDIHADAADTMVSGVKIYQFEGRSPAIALNLANAFGAGDTTTPPVNSKDPILDPRFNLVPNSVLIEAGNLNNDSDFAALMRPTHRDWLARTIVSGLVATRRAQTGTTP